MINEEEQRALRKPNIPKVVEESAEEKFLRELEALEDANKTKALEETIVKTVSSAEKAMSAFSMAGKGLFSKTK